MSKAVIEAARPLPYAPDDLCRMVGDVREYPKFVPWLQGLKISSETPLPNGGWEGVAEAIVGWRAIKEKFATRVRCAPDEGAVDVALVSGPFKALENRWRFTANDKGGTNVKFWLAYQFKNPILQGLASANSDKAGARIMQAFENEAKRRFG